MQPVPPFFLIQPLLNGSCDESSSDTPKGIKKKSLKNVSLPSTKNSFLAQNQIKTNQKSLWTRIGKAFVAPFTKRFWRETVWGGLKRFGSAIRGMFQSPSKEINSPRINSPREDLRTTYPLYKIPKNSDLKSVEKQIFRDTKDKRLVPVCVNPLATSFPTPQNTACNTRNNSPNIKPVPYNAPNIGPFSLCFSQNFWMQPICLQSSQEQVVETLEKSETLSPETRLDRGYNLENGPDLENGPKNWNQRLQRDSDQNPLKYQMSMVSLLEGDFLDDDSDLLDTSRHENLSETPKNNTLKTSTILELLTEECNENKDKNNENDSQPENDHQEPGQQNLNKTESSEDIPQTQSSGPQQENDSNSRSRGGQELPPESLPQKVEQKIIEKELEKSGLGDSSPSLTPSQLPIKKELKNPKGSEFKNKWEQKTQERREKLRSELLNLIPKEGENSLDVNKLYAQLKKSYNISVILKNLLSLEESKKREILAHLSPNALKELWDSTKNDTFRKAFQNLLAEEKWKELSQLNELSKKPQRDEINVLNELNTFINTMQDNDIEQNAGRVISFLIELRSFTKDTVLLKEAISDGIVSGLGDTAAVLVFEGLVKKLNSSEEKNKPWDLVELFATVFAKLEKEDKILKYLTTESRQKLQDALTEAQPNLLRGFSERVEILLTNLIELKKKEEEEESVVEKSMTPEDDSTPDGGGYSSFVRDFLVQTENYFLVKEEGRTHPALLLWSTYTALNSLEEKEAFRIGFKNAYQENLQKIKEDDRAVLDSCLEGLFEEILTYRDESGAEILNLLYANTPKWVIKEFSKDLQDKLAKKFPEETNKERSETRGTSRRSSVVLTPRGNRFETKSYLSQIGTRKSVSLSKQQHQQPVMV